MSRTNRSTGAAKISLARLPGHVMKFWPNAIAALLVSTQAVAAGAAGPLSVSLQLRSSKGKAACENGNGKLDKGMFGIRPKAWSRRITPKGISVRPNGTTRSSSSQGDPLTST